MIITINKQLGWELADHLGRRLSAKERTAVFAALGSGDDRSAIHRLILIAATNDHLLPPTMTKDLKDWVHAHDAEDIYAPALARIQDTLELCR
ncbi:hypothetical protein QM588_24875 [Rhodococcus sp. IEGM 1354]|uniref:hypothetical protein n=1 Tax=Rhodococcus sp. IEGM 1354 TaxID=3047088 RepID=UPI0024B77FC0|nr:hypothetical protein [Rhodococcus sp. IEGM 1354]MDI9933661.1 hypothetical protein [Rhodococcus sp. IEGM 1354]